MSNGYYDIYLRRLNRYGTNYQDRVQTKREKEFDYYLLKSVYRVDFEYEEEVHPATFERYKQDETETLHYLLTKTTLNIPNGTILMIPDKDDVPRPWMIYYLENIKSSGYNRYVALKMSHFITWKTEDGTEYTSWAYFYGQENNMLKDELQSRSRSDARYTENQKLSFFIMPRTEFIKKDIYIEVGQDPFKEAYIVTGYDIQSSEGVEYVSIDPAYIRDTSPDPVKTPTDSDEDFFWLQGGNN